MYRRVLFKNTIYLNSNYHTTIVYLNKYSDTVILPKTKFAQKLVGKKLTQQNEHVFDSSKFNQLYPWQRNNLEGPEFVLHDGPPYANGPPHMGHAINKILKDTINRYQILCGKNVHYVPGWDCHGLPIELKATKKIKQVDKTPLYIRQTARDFATKTVEEQSKIFQSWGVMGDWKNPYLTYSPWYIKNQLKQFYKLYSKKLIYRDIKPVYWSPSSRTALAEAELEYNDKHKSPAAVIRFKIYKLSNLLQHLLLEYNNIYALIWTTTPWTLPSNQAICFNNKINYSLVKDPEENEVYIIATDLVENVSKLIKKELQIITSFKGEELANATYIFPFKNDQKLPLLPAEHATATKGTGLVHTAPAHGPDDFLVALSNKIPVKCMIDETGRFTKDSEQFAGLFCLDEGNEAVLKYLKKDVLSVSEYIHSYPYDWRTKKPIILRASQQWFIDTNAIKERAIELLNDVKIYPEKSSEMYKTTFTSNIKRRPYWCISRQRVWGVPIPVFYNKNTKEVIINENLIDHLNKLLDQHGTDFWWSLPLSDLIPTEILKENNVTIEDIEKGQDILDIWFDSGMSWNSVLGSQKTADLYLEGVDQFTGWFQSSLIISVALRDAAPFKSIYVHGFAVDEKGHKMSKSLGNVINPQDVIHGGKKQSALGVDTLRWWVICHASQDSTAFITENVLKSSSDETQKIRNTLRFSLACLNDYNYLNCNEPSVNELKVIDRYLLHLLYEFNLQVEEMYKNYQFNKLCKTIINFITNPISALYYSVIKDVLYCEELDNINRRNTQFVLDKLLKVVSKNIGPIMPFLVEELFQYYNKMTDDETFFQSVHNNKKNWLKTEYYQPKLANIMDNVINIKKDINKIGNAAELIINLEVPEDMFNNLEIFRTKSELLEVLQVSQLNVVKNTQLRDKNYTISSEKTDMFGCPRCKRFAAQNKDGLCKRCETVMNSLNKFAVKV